MEVPYISIAKARGFTTHWIKQEIQVLVHRFVNNYTNRAGCGFECADKKTQA